MKSAPVLAITALSPLAVGSSFCRLSGALWATVVVKASFQLVHGEPARLVTPLELVREDRAGAENGSLEAARETAPHLPNAGVVLTGHAHAPEGRAVPSMAVRLGISRDRPLIDKTLHVFGARAAAAPGAIAPFQKMALVYERAFGGPGVRDNPVGTGGPGGAALPNLVDPKEPQRIAGFGPLSGFWAARRGLLGGLDPAVLSTPVWEVPAGFDWRFFQAAPADQQLDRLRGDEWIVLDGMHPTLGRVQSRLPQVMAQARRQVVSGSGVVTEQPLELRADMLVIDADRLIASLIWRGRFAVESAEPLPWTRVETGIESPGKAIEWPKGGARSAAAARSPGGSSGPAPITANKAAGGPAAGATPAASKAQGFSTETQDVDLKAILAGAVPFAEGREGALPAVSAAARPAPFATGTGVVDLQKLVSRPVPFAEVAATSALPAMNADAPFSPAATLDVRLAAEAAPLPFATPDPSSPPAESVATPAAQKATPLWTGTADINLAQVLESARMPYGGPAAVVAAAAPELPARAAQPPTRVPAPAQSIAALVQPPMASPVPLPVVVPAPAPSIAAPVALPIAAPAPPSIAAPVPPRITVPTPVTPSGAALARKRAEALLADGRSFDGEDFAGANLSGLDLSGRSFVRCNLTGAKLRGVKLSGAKLNEAVLDEADLRGAVLEGAELRGASLVKANLERAKLAGCNGEGAVLREANLLGADLRRARFSGASFESASLRDVQGDGAVLDSARFDRADLTSGCFRDARLPAAILASAILERADFQRADLTGANLHQAVKRMAKFAGANMKGVVESAPADGVAAQNN